MSLNHQNGDLTMPTPTQPQPMSLKDLSDAFARIADAIEQALCTVARLDATMAKPRYRHRRRPPTGYRDSYS